MYLPAHNRENRLEVQHQLIEAHPLGLLVSMGSLRPVANAIPFLLDRRRGSFGILQAHMARANDQWRSLDQQNVLVVFQGIETYVSPALLETKRVSGKVVPTWNYAMVQVEGVASVQTEAKWLDAQIRALTNKQEQSQEQPWSVSDAPASYIGSQLRGIVGVEIAITAIHGKWKVSQDEPDIDRKSVSKGLSKDNPVMSELVGRYGKIQEDKE
jgi:transcriptional regulator